MRFYIGFADFMTGVSQYAGNGVSLVYFFADGASAAAPAVSEVQTPGGDPTGIFYFDYGYNTSIAYSAYNEGGIWANNLEYNNYHAVGDTASAIGDDTTRPATVIGYLKRIQELFEGNQTFTKSSGALTMYDRTGATLLASKTVTNSYTMVIRT